MTGTNVLDILAKSGESEKSGPIGFAVILVLCVAAYFLFKSMSKHLKKVREEFPTELPPDGPARSNPPSPQPVEHASVEPVSKDAVDNDAVNNNPPPPNQ